MSFPVQGEANAPILVISEFPGEQSYARGEVLRGAGLATFAAAARMYEFGRDDFRFVPPSPPADKVVRSSDKRTADFLTAHRAEFLDTLRRLPRPHMIVTLGKPGLQQLTRKPVKISRVRGVVRSADMSEVGWGEVPVLPLLSPGHVNRLPENLEVFNTDFHMLRLVADHDWSWETAAEDTDVDYSWCLDLREWLEDRPTAMAVDTETTGLRWYMPEVRALTVQFCREPGKAIIVPLNREYYPDLTRREMARLRMQVRSLVEDPAIAKAGHNYKFDSHILRKEGMRPAGLVADTQLLAFAVDENMLEKSLANCVRRWVPEMSGYSDVFDTTYDKSRMMEVPHDDMCLYGCGDADASYRLARRLMPMAMDDARQWNCYRYIQLPAIKTFGEAVEPHGIHVDVSELATLQQALEEEDSELYSSLISEVPVAIKRAHADLGLRFSRMDFVRDILFSHPAGLRLTPQVFTKSTKPLAAHQQVPSVSSKDHLPYFDHIPFVADLIKYQKLSKMRTTYVGSPDGPEGPTGFWQYLLDDQIHPSFMLHRAVTGRTNSADPNAQNFPKRGRLAKAFRRIFKARPGHLLLECDLSQAELRVAAWMAMEDTMLRIYREGGDIHRATAAAILGITVHEFDRLPVEERDLARFRAKAVNFGFLYGMGWRKFRAYAKTDYGISISDEEAQEMRNAFFRLYPGLDGWHAAMREFVNQHGYVRALHGAIRHLPNIHSTDDVIRQMAERQAINSPVQRFASDLGLIGMVRVCRDAPEDLVKVRMFVHDALVLEVPEEYAQTAGSAVKAYMESPPLEEWFDLSPPIPIVADVACGRDLASLEPMVGLEAEFPDWYEPHLDMAA